MSDLAGALRLYLQKRERLAAFTHLPVVDGSREHAEREEAITAHELEQELRALVREEARKLLLEGSL